MLKLERVLIGWWGHKAVRFWIAWGKGTCHRVYEGNPCGDDTFRILNPPRSVDELEAYFKLAPEVYGLEYRHPNGQRRAIVLRSEVR